MDLGSLELQIFVSLTVVLGAAFVALVCDYLKGNNEQLREHNIELRVRKEEQERRALLDPAGFLGQWIPGKSPDRRRAGAAGNRGRMARRAAASHEMMHSFAEQDALQEADARAAKLQGRAGDEEFEAADIPPLAEPRGGRARAGQQRSRNYRHSEADGNGWVSPETMARVARHGGGSSTRRDEDEVNDRDLPDSIPSAGERSHREPVPAASGQAGRKAETSVPPVAPAGASRPEHTETTAARPLLSASAEILQKEIERVAQLERQPAATPSGTILRPLTIPSLQLNEEIQRVAARSSDVVDSLASWHSPLLDEVIAASGVRVESVEPAIEAAVAAEAPAPMAVAVETPRAMLLLPAPAPAVAAAPIIATPETAVAEHPPEPVVPKMAGCILMEYAVVPRESSRSGLGVVTGIDYLPATPSIVKPAVPFALSTVSATPVATAEEPSTGIDLSLLALLPVEPETDWASGPIPSGERIPVSSAAEPVEIVIAPPPVVSEPFSIWREPDILKQESPVPLPLPAPIDISAARTPEPPPVPHVPDLLLPTGMHELSTWTRLLTLPNPMTGILFVIALQPDEGSAPIEKNGSAAGVGQEPPVDKLMASFIREGDFGVRTAENEWVFIYSHDVAGFNQRRVGMISEKLWDFQLRHMGLANVSFRWGAVDVQSEPLGSALDAARQRMNQTRQSRRLPGMDPSATRRVVNG